MTLSEVCAQLSLPEDYAKRIWNSNSHGELFHIYDYYNLLTACSDEKEKVLIGLCIVQIVEWAEKNWVRPESVFQHMPEMLFDTFSVTEGKVDEQSILNQRSPLRS